MYNSTCMYVSGQNTWYFITDYCVLPWKILWGETFFFNFLKLFHEAISLSSSMTPIYLWTFCIWNPWHLNGWEITTHPHGQGKVSILIAPASSCPTIIPGKTTETQAFSVTYCLKSNLSFIEFDWCDKISWSKVTWEGKCLFHLTTHHTVSLRELKTGTQDKNWSRGHAGILLTGLLLAACYVFSLRGSCVLPRRGCVHSRLAFLHQPLVKEMFYIFSHMTIWLEHLPPIEVLSFQETAGFVKLTKTKQNNTHEDLSCWVFFSVGGSHKKRSLMMRLESL